MNPQEKQDRWQRVKGILAEALEHPESQRKHFLEEACRSDLTLLAEVESLLSYEQPQDHLTELEFSADSFKQPDRIGVYKIIRTLGRGGMGAVYLAARDDDEYSKQVAIKLIRQDMSTEFVRHRFLNERQILAALDHPNIARLLDGGTVEGLPYLVMDYIEGVLIHEYCDQNKLNTEKRLRIFLQLCAAVQYAHQRLVIHRDIKPGNILVTNEGVPKLLDFGIAKLLTPELEAQTPEATTGTAMRLMTPDYASPEQVRGEMITTSSDIYSLGVLLYELLTGHSPYRPTSDAIHDIIQAICETEPEKPSTVINRTLGIRKAGSDERITAETVSRKREGEPDKLRRSLRGDIDNILLKALRKVPRERYGSVEQFSEDIRRHLDGLPVFAKRPTLVYRARKFVRRNQVTVAAAVLIVIILIGGIIGINQQRLRAERRFNDVRRLAHSVVFDYHDAIADLPGSTQVRQRLVKDALAYLDSLAMEAKDDQELQRELAAAYVKIGDVQGNSYVANLGNVSGALASYRKSLDIRQRLVETNPDNVEWQSEITESYERIGDMLRTNGNVKSADENYHQAIKILKQFLSKRPDDPGLRRRLAKLLYHVANLKGMARGPNTGDITGCIEYHRQAITIREALYEREPGNVMLCAELQESHGSLADILLSLIRVDEAEPHVHRAMSLAKSLVGTDSKSVKFRRILMGAQDSLGRLLQSKGKAEEAMDAYKQCLDTAQSLLAADPNNKQSRMSLASRNLRIGVLLMDQGNPAEALEYHLESLKLNEEVAAADPANDAARRVIALDHLNIGEALAGIGNLKGALQSDREALSYFQMLMKKNPEDRQALSWLMRTHNQIGEALLKAGDFTKALESLRQSLALAQSAPARDPNIRSKDRQLALAHFSIGETHAAMASAATTPADQRVVHWTAARQAYQRSLDLFSKLKQDSVLMPKHADMPERITRKIQSIH